MKNTFFSFLAIATVLLNDHWRASRPRYSRAAAFYPMKPAPKGPRLVDMGLGQQFEEIRRLWDKQMAALHDLAFQPRAATVISHRHFPRDVFAGHVRVPGDNVVPFSLA
jgi:hypothetical protein